MESIFNSLIGCSFGAVPCCCVALCCWYLKVVGSLCKVSVGRPSEIVHVSTGPPSAGPSARSCLKAELERQRRMFNNQCQCQSVSPNSYTRMILHETQFFVGLGNGPIGLELGNIDDAARCRLQSGEPGPR